jgi:hypothetical protein
LAEGNEERGFVMMKSVGRGLIWFLISLPYFFLMACGGFLPGRTVPGETLASPELARSTLSNIMLFEQISGPGCPDRKVVNIKVIEEPKNVRPIQGHWAEEWLVDRCGRVVAYKVEYTTDEKGNAFIGAIIEERLTAAN